MKYAIEMNKEVETSRKANISYAPEIKYSICQALTH